MTTSAWIADGSAPRRVYAALLDAWRTERTVERASVLGVIADRWRASTDTLDRQGFVERAAVGDPRDTGLLARALFHLSLDDATAMVPLLDERLPDPTAAHGLIRGLSAWPAAFGRPTALGFWSDVFRRVGSCGDPSCLGALDRAIAPWRGPFAARWTVDRDRWLLFNRTVPDLQALIARRHPRRPESDGRIRDDAAALRRRGDEVAGLIGRAVEARDDPAALAVLADALQDHREPWGTFLAIQAVDRPDGRQSALERRLLALHAWDWLAPLTPVLRDVRFRGGFPDHARVVPLPALDRLLDAPAWQSFSSLELDATDGRVPTGPLPRLRKLIGGVQPV